MPLDYLAATPSASATETISWVLGAIIVVAGLFVLGMQDLLRFSFSRVWAISGVAFHESIRRRVLWIIPLAVLGIIAVVQFQRANDPQDAIRQSTKVCLFATGVVVMVTTIILSCTSLPKEIDNRVIFTIVTKPTTRLEIVLGKIVGFACVSGVFLLIMGLFTFGFLKLREARLLSVNNASLKDTGLDPAGRPLMEYYKAAGLLATKSMELPVATQVLARPPSGAFNEPVRILGGQSQYFAVVFDLTPEQRDKLQDAIEKNGVAFFETRYEVEYREPTPQEAKELKELNLPTVQPQRAAVLPGVPLAGGPLADSTKAHPVPQVTMHVLSLRGQQVVDDRDIGSVPYLRAQYEQQQQQALTGAAARRTAAANPNVSPDPDGVTRAYLALKAIEALLQGSAFELRVYGATPAVEYLVGPRPAKLVVNDANGRQVMSVDAAPRPHPPKGSSPLEAAPVGADPAAPIFLANLGRYGLQILGRADGKGTVAAYHFADAQTPQTDDGQASFEVRIGIEGSAMDYESDAESVVRMSMQVRNGRTGKISEPLRFVPENNRTTPIHVPAEFVQGGEFDVYVRALTDNQYFGLGPSGVTLVTAERSFAFNLVKSLLTLWMMAILVISIGVFCSTWLSWPIAIVLTLMMLLGHWGVTQIGDSSASLGADVTQGLSLDDPTGARIVRTSVNALQTFMNVVAAFLPDISKFSVTEDIERGISIPPAKILEALGVLAFYGVPVTVLAYVFLKRKEVAP
jgi:ABC-type transport system involved in multi-copper enzyme maturation permease subunit